MSDMLPGDYWLVPVMKSFTWFGYPQAYMIIIAIIYWSYDRNLGLRMAIFLPVVSTMNSILKQAFHAPRPYWVDAKIKAILVSNGFGMPSGHAQAATVWLYAGNYIRKGWFWITAIFLVIMVGFSRVYLGVHFPGQVLAGWAIGIVVALLFIRFETGILEWFLNLNFNIQLVMISGITLLFLILGGVFVYLLRDWEMPVKWILHASDDLAGKDESILSSIGLGAVAGNAGGFMGVALGALFLHRRGEFDSRGTVWSRVLRSVVGLIIFFVIYGIFMLTSPDQARTALYSIWRFSGFFVISISAIYFIPLFLIRINMLKSLKES